MSTLFSGLCCHQCKYACVTLVCKIYRLHTKIYLSLKTHFSSLFRQEYHLPLVTDMCCHYWLCSRVCVWHSARKNFAGSLPAFLTSWKYSQPIFRSLMVSWLRWLWELRGLGAFATLRRVFFCFFLICESWKGLLLIPLNYNSQLELQMTKKDFLKSFLLE